MPQMHILILNLNAIILLMYLINDRIPVNFTNYSTCFMTCDANYKSMKYVNVINMCLNTDRVTELFVEYSTCDLSNINWLTCFQYNVSAPS